MTDRLASSGLDTLESVDMTVTSTEDTVPTKADTKVRLKVDVYDRIARKLGYSNPDEQATWHGLARSAMYRIRGGGNPSAATIMQIAADCGVSVETLWERVA